MSERLRPELGDLPERIERLPVARGYPVPWFVEWKDGVPEFRVMDGRKFSRAIKERRCWVCGDVLGSYLSFVIGPMCAVNRTTSEPPCHHECAVWSAQYCPFLSRPHMARREDAFTETCLKGEASLDRNPGCACVWTARSYEVIRVGEASGTGYLIRMGDAVQVEWFAEGRVASRGEVLASITSGMPLLEQICERERTALDRLDARAALAKSYQSMQRWLPNEVHHPGDM